MQPYGSYVYMGSLITNLVVTGSQNVAQEAKRSNQHQEFCKNSNSTLTYSFMNSTILSADLSLTSKTTSPSLQVEIKQKSGQTKTFSFLGIHTRVDNRLQVI